MEIVRKDTKPAPITLDMVPAGTTFEFEVGHVYMRIKETGFDGASFVDLETGIVYVVKFASEKPVKILNATVVINDKDGEGK